MAICLVCGDDPTGPNDYAIGGGSRRDIIKKLGFSDYPTEAECRSKMKSFQLKAYRKNLLYPKNIHIFFTETIYVGISDSCTYSFNCKLRYICFPEWIQSKWKISFLKWKF